MSSSNIDRGGESVQSSEKAFLALWDGGYCRLVPIVPPDAELSPQSSLFKRPKCRGKAVGERGPYGWRGFNWHVHETSKPDLERWGAMGAGVGVRTGEGLIAIDADTLDPKLADLVLQAALEILGPAPRRVGRAPKFLLPYRVSAPTAYQHVSFIGVEGKRERIELLGEGRQFVALGIHPITRAIYAWPDGMPPLARLSVISQEQIDAFFARLVEVLPEAQRQDPTRAIDRCKVDQDSLTGPIEAVRAAVGAIPNETRDREGYVEMGVAIKAALRDHPEEAFDLFWEWSAKWTAGEKRYESAVSDWNGFHPPFRLGADYLYARAARHTGECMAPPEQFFEPIADEGDTGIPISDPHFWTRAEILETFRQRLPALSAGPGFEALREIWHDFQGVTPAELDRALAAARAEGSVGPDAWPAPIDMFADGVSGDLPDLTRGVLTPAVEGFVFDTAERMGVSPTFCAAAALATVSGAIGSRLRIQPKARDTSWTETPFLWFALVEDPGGLKSPVINAFTQPLSQLDHRHSSEDGRKRADWAAAAAAHKRRSKDAPDPGSQPRIRRYVVDNFTREALSGVLSENSQGVLAKAEELSGLIGALDAYKSNRGSDRPLMLRLFDGQELRVDRVGAGAAHVPCWGASILGGIQPKKIQDMATDLEADGMLQRFLPVMGGGGGRTEKDRSPDAAAMRAYADLVTGLTRLSSIFDEPVTLSDEAQTARVAFMQRVKVLRDLPDIAEGWLTHLGKWPGIFARLLLICHAAERLSAGGVEQVFQPVSGETAKRVVQLSDLLLTHALRFYESCVGIGQTGDDARWIAGHILAKGPIARITQRTITDAKTQWRDEPQKVARAMRMLDALGWVRADVSERSGRWGATRWDVNPTIFAQFPDRAEAERLRRAELQARIIEARTARKHLALH